MFRQARRMGVAVALVVAPLATTVASTPVSPQAASEALIHGLQSEPSANKRIRALIRIVRAQSSLDVQLFLMRDIQRELWSVRRPSLDPTIVEELTTFVDSDNLELGCWAASALGTIGQPARGSLPSLERLLARVRAVEPPIALSPTYSGLVRVAIRKIRSSNTQRLHP
jgi:hypothetical protein